MCTRKQKKKGTMQRKESKYIEGLFHKEQSQESQEKKKQKEKEIIKQIMYESNNCKHGKTLTSIVSTVFFWEEISSIVVFHLTHIHTHTPAHSNKHTHTQTYCVTELCKFFVRFRYIHNDASCLLCIEII
jgi:hypothetical protein